MYLLCGLGNPGKKYKFTRHNVGFRIIDKLISFYEINNYKSDNKTLIHKGFINQEPCFFFKSLNYMNLTGPYLSSFINFYKISLDKTIIIHDDLDIKFGKIKYKKGGSNGGHKGLESIDEVLGTEYFRLRIGIGHPGQKNLVDKYVVENFKDTDEVIFKKLISLISKNFSFLINNNKDLFLNKIAEQMDQKKK